MLCECDLKKIELLWDSGHKNNCSCRPVHPPYSSAFSTEFNPEYGNTDLLFRLRKRSSPKYGNAHGHLNIFLR